MHSYTPRDKGIWWQGMNQDARSSNFIVYFLSDLPGNALPQFTSEALGRVHFLQNRNWQNRTSSYFGSRKLAQISSLFCLVHISTIPISRRHTVYHSRNNYTELETDIVAELIDDLAFETFVGHGDTLKRSERTEQKKKAFETSAGRFKYQRERLRVELKHKHKQEHI